MEMTAGRASIISVKPTVFFVGEGHDLRQMVDVGVSNPGAAVDFRVRIRFDGREEDVHLGKVESGDTTHRVAIPDIRERVPVEFALYAGDHLHDQKEFIWTPGKHWNVYLVQVSHHDLGYTDLPSNVLEEYNGFFDDMLDFCNETDDYPEESKFRYTVEQAWSILHYIHSRPPEVVDEIVRRVKEGRLEVCGLFGNQISEIHGPEELIRTLYPAFSLKREYGIPITTAELNDVPGLSWGLCAALAGAGIRCFAPALPTYFDWEYSVHGFWDDDVVLPRGKPDAFWWEAPNGERVLLWMGASGAGGTSDPRLPELPDFLRKVEDQGYAYDALRYWVMGGERDNAPPIIEFAYACRKWNERWAYPRLICGTSAMFFEHLMTQIPDDLRVFRGELPGTDYPVGTQCTAHETAIARNTHDSLLAAERFATIAAEVTDYPYPDDLLTEAYDALMLYDEHTWGQADVSGLAQTAEIAWKAELACRAGALAEDVIVKALNKIADAITLKDEGYHILLFNPLDREQSTVIRAVFRPSDPCSRPMSVCDPTGNPDEFQPLHATSALGRQVVDLPAELGEGAFELIDIATGTSVPYEIEEMTGPRDLTPDAASRWSCIHVAENFRYAIRFRADDVPALGYRVYRIVPTESKPRFDQSFSVGGNTIENRFYRVELDPKTGAIASIYDKELGKELVDPGAPHKLNQVIVRASQTAEEYELQDMSISKGDCGPVSASLRVTGSINCCPQITQEIRLYADEKRIDLATRLLRDSTPLHEVFIAFPFKVDQPEFRYEGALSVVEPLKDQFPGSNTDYYAVQHWATVSDGESSVVLASRDAAVIEFGGLWPGYVSQAHHAVRTPHFGHDFLQPGEMTKGWMYSYVMANNFRTNFKAMQVTDTLFRYSITSGAGGWKEAGAREFGWSALVAPEPVFVIGPQEGPLSDRHSFCRVTPSNVLLLALKQAEDENGLIVRLWETEGMETEAEISMPFVSIADAWETNLVEEDVRQIPSQQHSVRIRVKANGLSTVRVICKR